MQPNECKQLYWRSVGSLPALITCCVWWHDYEKAAFTHAHDFRVDARDLFVPPAAE